MKTLLDKNYDKRNINNYIISKKRKLYIIIILIVNKKI